MEKIFEVIFVIVPILAIGIIAFTVILMFSTKMRGKFMSKQIKATKYMLDEAKDALMEMGNTVGNINIQMKKNIIEQNEDLLKELATQEANIEKEGIEIKTHAIQKGLSRNNVYCKYCGKSIDGDSIFCKHCGKEQKRID